MSLKSRSLSMSDDALILKDLGVKGGIRQWNKWAVFQVVNAIRRIGETRAGSDFFCAV